MERPYSNWKQETEDFTELRKAKKVLTKSIQTVAAVMAGFEFKKRAVSAVDALSISCHCHRAHKLFSHS